MIGMMVMAELELLFSSAHLSRGDLGGRERSGEKQARTKGYPRFFFQKWRQMIMMIDVHVCASPGGTPNYNESSVSTQSLPQADDR